MTTKNTQEIIPQPAIFRVRAVGSFHRFYGDEHPDLNGSPMELSVGDPPKEIPASLAEYFNTFPGLRVDTLPEPNL